jgi:proline iminopeptidase
MTKSSSKSKKTKTKTKTKKDKQRKRNKTRRLHSLCLNEAKERMDALMFPICKPRRRGHIKVSNLHTVAYYTYGDPANIPHLYLHGGPGGDINDSITNMFDLKKYYLVAIDQRGCGKSTPTGELRENTTQDLISDIEVVRQELGIDKWTVVGFSWGSTLAVYYTQQHAERVNGILIGGVFMGTKRETDYIENGHFVKLVFPVVWERYLSILSKEDRKHPAKAYQRKALGRDGISEQNKALRHYEEFQESTNALIPHTLSDITKYRERSSKTTLAYNNKTGQIFHHYFAHKCFFPRDEYLLETRNMNKIKNIPMEIVQGRYDIVTPTLIAHQVHQKLPHSNMHVIVSGHQGIPYEYNKQVIDSLKELNK